MHPVLSHLLGHTSQMLALLKSKSTHSSEAKRSGQDNSGNVCLHSNNELLCHFLQSADKLWRDRPCVNPNQSGRKQEARVR